jgi:hypothetical protein
MGPDINIAPQLTSTKEKSPEVFPPGLVAFLHQSLVDPGAPNGTGLRSSRRGGLAPPR